MFGIIVGYIGLYYAIARSMVAAQDESVCKVEPWEFAVAGSATVISTQVGSDTYMVIDQVGDLDAVCRAWTQFATDKRLGFGYVDAAGMNDISRVIYERNGVHSQAAKNGKKVSK